MREKFRAWAELIETFFIEVVFEERHDFKARLTRAILFGSSKVYHVLITIHRWLINVRIFRDKTLGVQVIAVGNLTVGGTGKTPVVEKFARVLQNEGRKVAILSRGYRSRPAPLHQRLLNKILFREDETSPRVVSDGRTLLLDSEMAGDEPYMLASNLRDVIVLVDKDRVKSGRYAIEKFGCDTLLLDDGFQYWRLRGRRHDVVLIDRQQPSATNICSRAAPCASRIRTSRAPTPFSSPKATARPGNCASASPGGIPAPPSSNACISRCISRTCSRASARGSSCSREKRSRR